jgi:hypothetical protein
VCTEQQPGAEVDPRLEFNGGTGLEQARRRQAPDLTVLQRKLRLDTRQPPLQRANFGHEKDQPSKLGQMQPQGPQSLLIESITPNETRPCSWG